MFYYFLLLVIIVIIFYCFIIIIPILFILLLLLLLLYVIIIFTISSIIYIYLCTDGSAPIIGYFRGCTFIYHLFGSKNPQISFGLDRFCQGVAPGVFYAVDGMKRMKQRQGPLDMKEKAGEMMEIKVWNWWLSGFVMLVEHKHKHHWSLNPTLIQDFRKSIVK